MSSSSNPPQTQIADPSSTFKSMLDDALAEYKKKTGDDLQALWLASELQTCESVDSVLDVLREQAKAFERSGDRKLMKWIDPLVHVLYTFSGALGDGIGVPFPPAKVICTGIGVLLGAAKDVRASHGAIIDLFERIESFFKRLEVYKQISLTTEMAEVLVKIVIELLSILSIATKEVRRRRAKLFARKLLGMTDIEDALKRLDSLIQEEFRMATAQILKVAIEIAADVKDGADKTNIAMQQMLNDVEGVKCDVGVVKRNVEEVKWVQIEQDIHKWFSPPDPSTNYNIACKAQYEGTTTWFFQGTKFKHWTSVGSLLWIHGKPGSGKSILCSSIINHAMSLRDAEKASLAYFYFDFRDKDKKQDLRNLVTSLLVQLSSCTSPCCEIISRLYSSHGKGAQQPGNGALTKCLREMLLVATEQPIYIIIDALDECPNSDERPDFGMSTPREDVLDLLKSLVRMGLPKLHICVTSRPEIDIKMALERLPHNAVSLHDEIGQKKDISDYVRGIVYSDRMWRLRDGEKRLVIEELTNKADGMFRWVICQLKVVQDCFPSSLRRTLDQLPKSLDETYVRVLRQIPQANQAHAHRMLQCLLVAVRPLRVKELAELLAFEFDETQGGIPKYRGDWRLDDQTQAVLSTCSSLVTIVKTRYSGRVVQFSHFSVKEFLMSNRLGNFSQYHIHSLSAHIILTQACLGFLLRWDDPVDKKIVKSLPLAEYAARHWVEHAKFEDVASRVKDGLESLFDSDKPHFAAWIEIYDMDDPHSRLFSNWETNPMPVSNPLYYSVLCGFYDLVEHLAIEHPEHVNEICGRYRFPLVAALEEDHVEIAELLLEYGANVDFRETTGKTILLEVLSSYQPNFDKKVKLLLKHGADANSPDSNGKTPLHILSECQTKNEDDVLDLARLLFEHGADANRRDKDSRTPLHLAIGRDWFKLALILLEQGADANARWNGSQFFERTYYASPYSRVIVPERFKRYGTGVNRRCESNETPLHSMARGKYLYSKDDAIRVAHQLLVRGADVNAPDEEDKTPLHLALSYKNIEVARMLLDGDASANSRDNQGRTPLHAVAEYYSTENDVLAYLLLERGADVNALDDSNETALHLASYFGSVELVLVLLNAGANASAENAQGQTPLHLVSQCPYHSGSDGVGVAQLLLEHGADVNAQDKNHATPSDFASFPGGTKIASLLLDNGGKTNANIDKRPTPRQLRLKCVGPTCTSLHTPGPLQVADSEVPSQPLTPLSELSPVSSS